MIDRPDPASGGDPRHWYDALLIALAFFGAMARIMLDRRRLTPLEFARQISLAAFAGATTYLVVQGFDWPDGVRGASVGVAAFLADDVLMALVVVGRMLVRDPIGTIVKLRSGWLDVEPGKRSETKPDDKTAA